MSGGLIIFLIIVVWLIVLAPLLLRGQKAIRHSGEALEETRVVYSGGTELPRMPRHRAPSTVLDHDTAPAPSVAAEEDSYELVDAMVDEDDSEVFTPTQRVAEVDIVDGQVVAELPAAYEEGPEIHVEIAEGAYDFDSSFTDSADLMHPAGAPAAVVDNEAVEGAAGVEAGGGAAVAEETVSDEPELSEAEIAFAAKRARRGGWDPEREARRKATRYQRRARALTFLGVLTLLAVVLGVMFGGSAWWATAVMVILLTMYLWALRQQVRAEETLRVRRIRQLRRARLGVRNAEDADLPLPRSLRHPGAVVLGLDDESPDFEDLAVYEVAHEDDHRRAG